MKIRPLSESFLCVSFVVLYPQWLLWWKSWLYQYSWSRSYKRRKHILQFICYAFRLLKTMIACQTLWTESMCFCRLSFNIALITWKANPFTNWLYMSLRLSFSWSSVFALIAWKANSFMNWLYVIIKASFMFSFIVAMIAWNTYPFVNCLYVCLKIVFRRRSVVTLIARITSTFMNWLLCVF